MLETQPNFQRISEKSDVLLENSNNYETTNGTNIFFSGTCAFNVLYYAGKLLMRHNGKVEEDLKHEKKKFSECLKSEQKETAYNFRSEFFMKIKGTNLSVDCSTSVEYVFEKVFKSLNIITNHTQCSGCEQVFSVCNFWSKQLQKDIELKQILENTILKCNCGVDYDFIGNVAVFYVSTFDDNDDAEKAISIDLKQIPRSILLNNISLNLFAFVNHQSNHYTLYFKNPTKNQFIEYDDFKKKPLLAKPSKKVNCCLLFYVC
jgi:hypothetical protein